MKLFAAYPTVAGLKDYQQRVIDELREYAKAVMQLRQVSFINNPAEQAFINQTRKAWQPLTKNPDTPFVCLKVPTGGGKTIIAAHAAGIVYDELLQDKSETGTILWLTPSETIRSQTLRALKDQEHPYRKVIDDAFSTPVYVMDNVEALSVRPEQVRQGLTIIVSTMQAMKRENKEGLKFYEDNGALRPHFAGEDEQEDSVYSLYEVVRRERPLIIADEGHNAKTVLALDVVESLNPSFVLELTATPHDVSNVLSVVSALDLKQEQMVKLPVNVFNVSSWQDTLGDAVRKRRELEDDALKERKNTGEFIRPMLLIQAEVDKPSGAKIDVGRVKEFLVNDLKVPESQVKIKTGTRDELGDTDLLAEDVEVRFIITRDALREGWDAPFAYVLASVFNLGAPTAVEQLLGRVLRLPNVKEKGIPALNEAYVYTSAEQFGAVLKSIVKGMVENGYSRNEVRVQSGAAAETGAYIEVMDAQVQDLSIPTMAVEDSSNDKRHELRYVSDLLEPNFNIDTLEFVPQPLNDPVAQAGRVDVVEGDGHKGDGIKKDIVAAPISGGTPVGAGTRDELTKWLLKKVGRYPEISDPQLKDYIEKAVDELLTSNSLAVLHRAKYQVRDEIRRHLAEHYEAWAKKRYEELKVGTGVKKLVADDAVAYQVPAMMELPASQLGMTFSNSVFPYAGKLNEEETELALELDKHPKVRCWYRNLDKGGFSLQGYRKDKFNPDFIAFTKSGKVVVLEYKGEDRVSNDDTQYKERIGNDLAALDKEHRYFKVVTKSNMQQTIQEVARL